MRTALNKTKRQNKQQKKLFTAKALYVISNEFGDKIKLALEKF